MRFRVVLAVVLGLCAFSSLSVYAQSADLSVTKTGPASAAAGTDVPYDIAVANFGGDDAASVVLNDAIPAGMTFVSLFQNSGPAFVCTTPAVGSGGPVNCTIALLANGAGADFSLTVHIDSGTAPGTSFTNVATISSVTPDPNSENDASAAATATPSTEVDLGVTKSGPSEAAPNTDISYTIGVSNSGASAAANAHIADALPGTLTFVSLTQDSGPPFLCTTPAVGSGGTISCDLASFAGNATASFTLKAHVPGSTASGTTFTNSATVSTTSTDVNPENDTSSAATTISAVDLSVIKTGPATIIAGQNISYGITLANGGPDAAASAQFSDLFPAGTSFVSLVQNTGPAASCSNNTSSATCSIASLANGASATFTLTLLISSSVANGTTLTNTVTASSAEFDTNSSNDTSSTSATVTGAPDLAVNKTGPASVITGSNITYAITVANNGASAASTVQLTDVLPAGTTFVSLLQNTGPVFSCTTPAVGAGGTITCSIASLAAGASATFALVVGTSSVFSGTLSNTATATTASAEGVTANNASTAVITVTQAGPIPALSPGLLVLLTGMLVAMAFFATGRSRKKR